MVSSFLAHRKAMTLLSLLSLFLFFPAMLMADTLKAQSEFEEEILGLLLEPEPAELDKYYGPKMCIEEKEKLSEDAFCENCNSYQDRWHFYGKCVAQTVMFECGNARAKAEAIQTILEGCGIWNMCDGSCSDSAKSCLPLGAWSMSNDGVDLALDNKAPFCGYTVTAGDADFVPSSCDCV